MTDAPIIKSMTLPVRFHTSVSTYVGPDGETQVWQGSASVCGQIIANIPEYHGVRTEKAVLIRLTEQVRDINRDNQRSRRLREHLNREGA